MKNSSDLPFQTLMAAVALGAVGDALLRSAPWGLNFFLWVLALVVTLVILASRNGSAVSREMYWLTGGALAFAGFFVWRGSPSLLVLDALAVAASLTLATVVTSGRRLWRAGLSRYGLAVAETGIDVLRGVPELAMRHVRSTEGGGRALRPIRAGALGAVFAIPLLTLFGGLLMEADAVFAQLITQTFDVDFSLLMSHVAFAGLLGWLACGYLRRVLFERDLPLEKTIDLARPSLGSLEISVPLALLDLLFLVFVIVQMRYLFGDHGLVEATTGLTYSEYARHGFFQLVAVAGLAVPLLLTADWALEEGNERSRSVFQALAALLVALLFVIMASAIQRMRLYHSAYGLTELRLYSTAFMGWIALLLLWFCVTVLRGRRHLFAFGALVGGFQVLLALNLLNPDALIVRVNAGRASHGQPFDAAYAASLSADAVPGLLTALRELEGGDHCHAAARVLDRWSNTEPGGWRSWNAARARARRLVAERRAWLELRACPERLEPPEGGSRRSGGAEPSPPAPEAAK